MEHPQRIVIRSIPELRVKVPEEPPRRRFPGPPKVEDHLAQRFKLRREIWDDIIGLNVRHGSTSVPLDSGGIVAAKSLAASVPFLSQPGSTTVVDVRSKRIAGPEICALAASVSRLKTGVS